MSKIISQVIKMRIFPFPWRSGWGKRIQYRLRNIYTAIKENNLPPFRICVLEVIMNIPNVFWRGCNQVITETQGNLLWVSHYYAFIQKDNSFLAPRQKLDFFPGVLACLLSQFSRVWLCATLRTVAHQAPLSIRILQGKYWSGLPCPPPRDLPNPGIEPRSPALQADSLPTELSGKSKSGIPSS